MNKIKKIIKYLSIVIGIYIIASIFFAIFMVSTEEYEDAKEYFNKGNYKDAIRIARLEGNKSQNYLKSQELIFKIANIRIKKNDPIGSMDAPFFSNSFPLISPFF